MCTYQKRNGTSPCCTHDCDGCVWNEPDEENEKYGLTPWGCLSIVLTDYGIDLTGITPVMEKHMVEDFMDSMVLHGHVKKAGGIGEDENKSN